jgi:hypothetical protein
MDTNDFDLLLKADLEQSLESNRPLTIEGLKRKYHVQDATDAQRERIEKLKRDASAPVLGDAFEVEALIMQKRAAAHVTSPGQVFTPSGKALSKAAASEQQPAEDALMKMLETEIADPLARLESASALGREPLRTGESDNFAVRVWKAVAKRTTSPGARALAEQLVAREGEV